MQNKLIEYGGRALPSDSEQKNVKRLLVWVTSIPNSGIEGDESSGSVGGAGASSFAQALLTALNLENTQLVKVGPVIREEMASMSNLLHATSYTAETLPDHTVAKLREQLEPNFDRAIDAAIIQTTIARMVQHKSNIALMEGKVVGIAKETFNIQIPADTAELRIGLYATPLVSAKRTQKRFKQQSGTDISLAEAQRIRRLRFYNDREADLASYGFSYTRQHMKDVVHCVVDSTYASPETLVTAFESWMIETCPTLYQAMFAPLFMNTLIETI